MVTSLGQPRDRDGETGVVIRLCAADDAELTLRRSAVSFRTADGESLAVGEGTPDGGRSWTDEPGADIVLLPDSVFLGNGDCVSGLVVAAAESEITSLVVEIDGAEGRFDLQGR